MSPRSTPTMSAIISPPSSSPADAAEIYAQPSDVTLINTFLRPWVTTGDTNAGGASSYVHAADLYSADPEELARRFRPAVSKDGDRTWYFLSPLRTKSPRDRRKIRAVADGTGCWHSEAAPKNVVDHLGGGRHVGYRQSFSFMRRGEDGADVRAGWIMAEFHLHHEGLGRKVEGLVLCKMYRSTRKHCPVVVVKHGPVVVLVGDDDDDVQSGVSLSSEASLSLSKAVDGEVSNDAVIPRWQPHCQNLDGTTAATVMTAAPLLKRKVVGDDEVSVMTTAMAPCTENKVVADDDDDDLLASQPAHKKMRSVAVVDDESTGAVVELKATTDANAPAAEAQLHCPQCGFHLAALQALVTLTTSKLIMAQGDKEEHQAMGDRTENKLHDVRLMKN